MIETYEVSSRGDKRFSALYAKLSDGRTIEQAYQQAKWSGKGKPAIHKDFPYRETYLGLWKQWANENPKLIEELRRLSAWKVLTDSFARTENNQAHALTVILRDFKNEECVFIINGKVTDPEDFPDIGQADYD